MDAVERRLFQRYNVDPLLCSTIPETRGVCVLRNISLTGAYFLNHTPPPIGSRVRVEFAEMPLEGYRLIGQVVRLDVTFRAARFYALRGAFHFIDAQDLHMLRDGLPIDTSLFDF